MVLDRMGSLYEHDCAEICHTYLSEIVGVTPFSSRPGPLGRDSLPAVSFESSMSSSFGFQASLPALARPWLWLGGYQGGASFLRKQKPKILRKITGPDLDHV